MAFDTYEALMKTLEASEPPATSPALNTESPNGISRQIGKKQAMARVFAESFGRMRFTVAARYEPYPEDTAARDRLTVAELQTGLRFVGVEAPLPDVLRQAVTTVYRCQALMYMDTALQKFVGSPNSPETRDAVTERLTNNPVFMAMAETGWGVNAGNVKAGDRFIADFDFAAPGIVDFATTDRLIIVDDVIDVIDGNAVYVPPPNPDAWFRLTMPTYERPPSKARPKNPKNIMSQDRIAPRVRGRR